VALSATVYNFQIDLSDVDRHVYTPLSLRVARHPSETEEYLVTRVLAYCLEYSEGIAFSAGLAEPDAPALTVRDLTGALRVWIEIGAPDAARLHKASKAAPRVVVYTHKNAPLLVRQWAGESIHRAAEVELYGFDREFIDGIAVHLDRRMVFSLTVTDRQLYASVSGETIAGAVKRYPLDQT
jgi:uncharacterized protein YaeQ